MKKTIHLTHGYVGYGKTTISKNINAIRISNDDIRMILFGKNYLLNKIFKNKINELVWHLAENAIRGGATDVLIESGNYKLRERKEYYERALKFADRVIFHSVICDPDVAFLRTQERTKQGGLGMGKYRYYRRLKKYYQPMTKDEFPEIIFYDNN